MCDYHQYFKPLLQFDTFIYPTIHSWQRKNIVMKQFFLENAPAKKLSVDLVKSGFWWLYYIQKYGKPLHPLAANPVLACGNAHPQLQYIWGVITLRSLYLRHSASYWCLTFRFPSHIHKETQDGDKRSRTWDSSWYIFCEKCNKI